MFNPFLKDGPRDDAEQQVYRLRNLIQRQPRFRAEAYTPDSTGMLIRVRDRDAGAARRRFMVKAAYEEVDEQVRREATWIQRLRAAKHIVDPAVPRTDPLRTAWTLPYLFMEYLESGSLEDFQQRVRGATRTLPDGTEVPLVLPNRLLWSIFLCLIRSCIGLAWPPQGPAAQLERPLGHQPRRLAHRDMHQGNIMFGDLEAEVAEHLRVPLVKLIDFGEARELETGEAISAADLGKFDVPLNLAQYRPATGARNPGIDRNLLDIGCIMARVIRGRKFGSAAQCREHSTDPDVHPSLDPDLRLLVQRCLAVDPANRPRLEELARSIGADEFSKTEIYYELKGMNPNRLESDDSLEYIVSTFILNADS
ncbi:hypothetical protein F5X99DRAFT_405641 [Biscogniauxia marginata]|nr:hypothetical protein F5X99DRAFT_405641 [Biscogniauxia marginata]